MRDGMTIGKLALAAGVNVETIRYYQRLRLIWKPARRFGAVHFYSNDAVARLRFIKRAQALGFSLREVGVLLDLRREDGCALVRELAGRKLAHVEKELGELAARRDALKALLGQCESSASPCRCPALDRLYCEIP